MTCNRARTQRWKTLKRKVCEKNAVTYLKILGDREVRRHVEQTQSLWGGKTAVHERLGNLKRRLEADSWQSGIASLYDRAGCVETRLGLPRFH
jgi:hypothetical protein